MNQNHIWSRRAVLRGIGTVAALPWMASAARAFDLPPLARPPRRLLWCYTPNGIHMPDWLPQSPGELPQQLPWILQPLAAHRARIGLVGGMVCDKARANGDGPGDHARASGAFLTGVQPLKDEGKILIGISADQIAAKSLQDATRFSSLAFGTEGGGTSGQCDSGYACGYSNNISWISKTSPLGKEIHPQRIFDRLFRSGREAGRFAEERRRKKLSVLDFLLEDSKDLATKLGNEDRAKLDEFLHGVRELEQRLARTVSEDLGSIDDSLRPGGLPSDRGEHLRLLADLLVLALKTDSTRVSTLMFANEGSNRSHPELNISGGHHELSHHRDNPEHTAAIRKINRFHAEQLAYLLDQLDAVAEEGGSLLDSVQLMYGSAIRDGNRHDHHDLPILMVAKDVGGVRPGHYVHHPQGAPLNNLHLAMLQSAGLATPLFGDATGVLKNPV